MGIDVEPALRLTTTFGDGAGEFEGSLNQSIQLSIEAGIAALEGAPRGGRGGLRSRRSQVPGRRPAGDLFTHGLVTVEAATALPAHLVPEDAIDSPPHPLDRIGGAPMLALPDACLATSPSLVRGSVA